MKKLEKATLISVVSIIVCACGALFQLAYIHQSDLAAYQEFLHQAKPVAKASPSTSSQKREGVRKDIWFTQEDRSRLHYRIQSEASTLTLLPVDDKLDIVENLESIQCWMQDKLYTADGLPMQQMRFFKANAGTYQYTTQQLVAQAVTLSVFRQAGHVIPLQLSPRSAFMQGVAKDVSFSVAGSHPQFRAEQFRATLMPRENPKNEETR